MPGHTRPESRVPVGGASRGSDDVRGTLAYVSLETLHEGGAAYTHVVEIIRGLERRGWNVLFFGSKREPGQARRGAVRRFLECMWVQFRAWRRRGEVDALYLRTHAASLPSAWWACRRGIPVVLEANGMYTDVFDAWPFTRRLAWLLRRVHRRQLRCASAVAAVTDGIAEAIRNEGGSARVVCVPNGANTDLFRPDAAPPPVSGDYVVFFGTLASWQGIPTLLEAIDLPQWPKDVRLVVAGSGVMETAMLAAHAQGRVTYLGRIPYRQVAPLVAGSLAAVSPQVNVEGRAERGLSPLKVYEALACGAPVVLTDFPGAAELVRENGCGLVIPPGDALALAEAVSYLRAHPDERHAMGARGREVVLEHHSWDARAQQIDDLLRGLSART